MLEKLKFWKKSKEERLDKIENMLAEIKEDISSHNKHSIESLIELNKGQEKLKAGQESIPDKLLEEIQDIREVEAHKTGREILSIIEENGGRINSGKLRNVTNERGICSEKTLYRYLKKLRRKGLIAKEKEGKKRFYKTKAEKVVDIP